MVGRYKKTYRKTYRKRQMYPNKYSWYNSKNALPLAEKAFEMAKYVATLVNVERKQIDTDITLVGTAIPVAAAVVAVPLTLCAQGDTDITRNGNKIKLSSISLKINLFNVGAAGSVANPTVRLLLVNDKVSSGAAPALTDVLDTASVIARYNPDTIGSRFKILMDKRYPFGFKNTTTSTGAGRQCLDDSFYKKVSWHVKYDGTTANIADATTGHLYAFLYADFANIMEGNVTSRVEFIDN